MYPFEELTEHYDALWTRIREIAAWVPERLDRTIPVRESWIHPELALGQTCGLPLVERLTSAVRVVGAFHPSVPDATGARYRAVVVATRPGAPIDFADEVAAVNEPDSLSGWLSLLHCIHGSVSRPAAVAQPVRTTGSHLASLAMLQQGDATVASIDAVTYAHAARQRPALVAGLHQIGWGPLVPSLPLITSGLTDDRRLSELRHAVADAVADPALRPHLGELAITGFTPLNQNDYEAAIRPLLAS